MTPRPHTQLLLDKYLDRIEILKTGRPRILDAIIGFSLGMIKLGTIAGT